MQKVREMKRESLECDLRFVGFILVSSPLKADSKAVIREIQSASHHVRNDGNSRILGRVGEGGKRGNCQRGGRGWREGKIGNFQGEKWENSKWKTRKENSRQETGKVQSENWENFKWKMRKIQG